LRLIMLAPGKLPGAFLADLLQILPTNDPNLILGPSVGEDAAVIDFAPSQDYLLVVKTDPITFATDEIGYYAVNVCANDLAVTGATPRFYLATVLLPANEANAVMAERIFRQIGDACRQLGIGVAGGHSEITRTVSQPIVAGTLLGEVRRGYVLRTGGAQHGDLVLLAGSAAIEGVSIIAREMRSQLLARNWPACDLDAAANYLHNPGISVMAPALLAADRALVTAMHDPTEGGVATGLLELAVAAGVGLAIDVGAIPVSELAARLCAEFGLDPLGTIASGALLATARERDVARLQQLWQEHGWPSAVIGRVRPKEEGLLAYRGGQPVEFPRFPVDEITKLWA
jgi:hydrogenase expression/formation protein HypE